MIAMLLAILLKVRTPAPLHAMRPYVLTLCPGFTIMGSLGRNPMLNRLVVYVSAALLVLLTSVYVMWFLGA